ncbi:MAG: phosphotransferase [Candidatus Margulisiibacteriota bacterium]
MFAFTQADHKKIIAQILQKWEQLELPPVEKGKFGFKLLPFRRGGQHSLINFMILSQNQPVLVVKVPRFKEGDLAFVAIENEARMLQYLSEQNILSGHAPKQDKLLRIENVPVLLTKAYQGQMLHSILDQEEDLIKLQEHLLSGAELLVLMQNKKQKKEITVDKDFINNYILEPLKLITKHYPQHIKKIESLITAALENKNIAGAKLPLVCFHREFNPWNILKEANGNLIVFDWEDAATEGLPLLDLYNYFIVSFRILIAGETEIAKKRVVAEKKKRLEALLDTYRQAVDKYCKTLKVAPELKDFLFLIFAINATSFFLEEKRQEIDYSRHWLSLLLNFSAPNCFENQIKLEFARHCGKAKN